MCVFINREKKGDGGLKTSKECKNANIQKKKTEQKQNKTNTKNAKGKSWHRRKRILNTKKTKRAITIREKNEMPKKSGRKEGFL